MVNRRLNGKVMYNLVGAFTLETDLISPHWGYDYDVYVDSDGIWYMDESDGFGDIEEISSDYCETGREVYCNGIDGEDVSKNDIEEVKRLAWDSLLSKGIPCEPSYEVLESNGGCLALAIFDKDGKCVYFHTGYEYTSNGLLTDLATLSADDGYDPTSWDGNCDGIDDVTPQELYNSWEDPSTETIAESGCVYYDRMGAAGKKAFHFDKIPVEAYFD